MDLSAFLNLMYNIALLMMLVFIFEVFRIFQGSRSPGRIIGHHHGRINRLVMQLQGHAGFNEIRFSGFLYTGQ